MSNKGQSGMRAKTSRSRSGMCLLLQAQQSAWEISGGFPYLAASMVERIFLHSIFDLFDSNFWMICFSLSETALE